MSTHWLSVFIVADAKYNNSGFTCTTNFTHCIDAGLKKVNIHFKTNSTLSK